MDPRQALLDARVAAAAEAWLTDPRDGAVYARFVAAAYERRRYLLSGGAGSPDAALGRPEPVDDADAPDRAAADARDRAAADAQDRAAADAREPSDADAQDPGGADEEEHPGASEGPARHDRGDGEDPEHPWPSVRSVGADLVGDPAAVLRRLRGG
jgi:hypothetical protein